MLCIELVGLCAAHNAATVRPHAVHGAGELVQKAPEKRHKKRPTPKGWPCGRVGLLLCRAFRHLQGLAKDISGRLQVAEERRVIDRLRCIAPIVFMHP